MSGLTYLAKPGELLTAKGRPSLNRFMSGESAALTPGGLIMPTRPTSLNTGNRLPYGAMTAGDSGLMEVISGDITYNTDNQIVTGKIFHGYVTVTGKYVTFRDCIFRGPSLAATATKGLCSIYSANVATTAMLNLGIRSTRFEFCTFRAQTPSQYVTGIQGYSFTAYRCEFSGTVDPVSATNPNLGASVGRLNVDLISCYMHDWYYQTPASSQSDGHTHNDGCQHNNGFDLRMLGCFVSASADPAISSPASPPTSKVPNTSGKGTGQNVLSCFLVSFNGGPGGDMLLAYNWFDQATTKINIAQKGKGVISNVVVRDNLVYDNGTVDRFAVVDLSTANANYGSWTNNRWVGGPRHGQTIAAFTGLGLDTRADT